MRAYINEVISDNKIYEITEARECEIEKITSRVTDERERMLSAFLEKCYGGRSL